MTNITGEEARMIEMCIEEYRCTLTPDLDFYKEQHSLLQRIEQKMTDIQNRERLLQKKNQTSS